MKHEMKARVMVGKSGRLKLVVLGKAKRTNTVASMQQGSSDSPEMAEEMGIVEAANRGGKETQGGEGWDLLMSHQAKALVEAVGL